MKFQQLLACALMLNASLVSALNWLPDRGQFRVPVKSYQELQFGAVTRQQYDFSCGSAALASLLTYHYDTPTEESTVFKTMFENGDRTLIKQQGFSLLDMKQYLTSRGFLSEGYKLPLEKIESLGLPVITLVDFDGYHHFVVIKGINEHSVIVGDPSKGTIVIRKNKFVDFYQGIALLVRNNVEVGRETFITASDYKIYDNAPLGSSVSRDSIGLFSITLPEPGDY